MNFQQFRLIREGKSRQEAEAERQSKSNPGSWELKNSGSSANPSWTVSLKPGGQVNKRAAQSSSSVKSGSVSSAVSKAAAKPAAKPVAKKPESKKPEVSVPTPVKKPSDGNARADTPFGKVGKPKPAPKKPVAKKPEVGCLGTGCPGQEHLGPRPPKKPVAKKPVAKKPVAKKPVAKKPYGPGNPHPRKGMVGIGGPVDEYGYTGHDRANNPDHPLNKKYQAQKKSGA